MTNTNNTKADWRTLTDKLTPEQISDLTETESVRGITAAGLLAMARQHVESNLGAIMCADLPTPAAVEVMPWQPDDDGDGTDYSRYFTITSDTVAGVGLDMAGMQHSSGHIEHSIVLDVEDGLSADQARALAAALLAAADELDRLDGGAR